MAKLNNEIKTGVVVVVAALLLLYLIVKMGGVKVTNGYELNVLFDYVNGLEDKAPVKLAGVVVGEVKKVTHTYDNDETKVLVQLALNGETKIREDSKIMISTTGLIGEKYIEITGGRKGSPVVERGKTLTGIDPFVMEELIAKVDSAVQDLQKLMGHADSVLVENKDDIRSLIMNLKDSSENLKDSSENLKEFSDEVKRNPWKLLMKGKEVPPAVAPGPKK
jgi:phospholipid/cholesterol/gamma-HCH transport system substrate-binding protein